MVLRREFRNARLTPEKSIRSEVSVSERTFNFVIFNTPLNQTLRPRRPPLRLVPSCGRGVQSSILAT